VVVDGIVYAAWYFGLVRGFDATTGETVWKVQTGGLLSGGTPAVANGVVYVRAIFPSDRLRAFDLEPGPELWDSSLSEGYYPVVAMASFPSARTMAGSERTTSATGDHLWMGACDGGCRLGTPAVSDGVLYASAQSGTSTPSAFAEQPIPNALTRLLP
jgi:outer membrane protein assembly factor BamB